MKIPHLLVIVGTIIVVVAFTAVVILMATDPNRGKDLDRLDYTPPPAPNVTVEPCEIAPTIPCGDDLVQHPLTGEWVTKEDLRRQEDTIRAILCNQGRTEYCEE